jgi:LPPG:FO 2-phospho-L-lactate transferase
VALSGGIGGAKLAFGLSQVLTDGELTVIANTGDDFEHLGLHVSPDVDTLLYTLSGVNNPDTGWGRGDETWSFMSALKEVGAPTWFQLGDKDLALNVFRTKELSRGKTLSDVVSFVAQQFGIQNRIIPMSDDPVRTMVDTTSGTLEFQDYFVRQKCQPVVEQLRYQGSERARPSPGFQAVMESSQIEAFVICPSNPYLSIDPIFALPGVRESISDSTAPVVAVSPVVAGESLKGPTGKIMSELGVPCNSVEVAWHYHGLIDGIIIDSQDAKLAAEIERANVQVVTANIVMKSAQDKSDLAKTLLSFARQLAQN